MQNGILPEQDTGNPLTQIFFMRHFKFPQKEPGFCLCLKHRLVLERRETEDIVILIINMGAYTNLKKTSGLEDFKEQLKFNSSITEAAHGISVYVFKFSVSFMMLFIFLAGAS